MTLADVLALHARATRYGNEDYSISAEQFAERREDDPDGPLDLLTPFDVCVECFRIEQAPEQDGDEHTHSVLDGLWPCRTIRAATRYDVGVAGGAG